MYRIGQLARMADVTPDTVRFYEKQGMMDHEVRTEGGFRLYSDNELQRLKFIRYARQLGFTLDSIKDLLSIRIDPEHHTCSESKGIVLGQLREVERRMEELQRCSVRYSICMISAVALHTAAFPAQSWKRWRQGPAWRFRRQIEFYLRQG